MWKRFLEGYLTADMNDLTLFRALLYIVNA